MNFQEPEMPREQVFAELEARGITTATVYFSGGNDSGGADSITLDPSGTNLDGGDALYHPLCAPIYAKYYTFAGEFSVDGKVVWDVAAKKVRMSGAESVETWDDFSQEV